MCEPHPASEGLSNLSTQGMKRKKTYFTDENIILKYVNRPVGGATVQTHREKIIQEANLNYRQEWISF